MKFGHETRHFATLESMSDFRDIIGENFSTRQLPRTKIGEFFAAKNYISDIGENF